MNGKTIKGIVVDAGHGGEDPGAVNGNIKEKDYNLKLANYIYNRLNELGVPVTITRNTDKTLSRAERLNIMNNSFGNDSDVIILSNHINSGGGEGAEVVYALRNNNTLANLILTELGNEGQKTRSVYQRRLPENPSKDYYYIMRETGNTEPVLIEYGFIDNNNDINRLNNDLEKYGEAVVRSISKYIGIDYNISTSNDYIVKSGDTLWSIAKANNISVEDLKKINNLSNNLLYIGMKLKISNSDNTNDVVSSNKYVVKSGDTLWSIAKLNNTNVNELIAINNLNSTILTPGMELVIINNNNNNNDDNLDVYIVKKGDSIYSIAINNGVTVSEIVTANKLLNLIIRPGDKLIIPTKQDNTSDNFVYIVKPGDTLYSIASKNNISITDLKKLNNLSSNNISIGKELILPRIELSKTYYVKKGDTLSKIAEINNTTVANIKEINNLSSDLLQIGQLLLLP